ncbi:DUF1178 family protein [Bordetella avium]|uniref:DUF1178 family protein n=1 Tax=Bordetella avium TaxID=521 RepID=UPI000FDBD879|nr:DUF1178 family protein [Bordetella avium]AZY53226.1 DUF1178 domain-containing protein [Bordetella avium]
MALKVFDLECEHGHLFEGWFSSHDDYDAQHNRGLLSCPVCASRSIVKRLSAPRLNVAHLHQPSAQTSPQALQAEALRQMRKWVSQTENVGPAFAVEARRIHEGEAAERPIRGTATPEERAELADDGIHVLPLPSFLDDDSLQ